MVRLGILLLLVCLSIWEWYAGARKHVYWLALIGLFAFFALRFGQGTDYVTYLSIYANVGPLQTIPNYFTFQYNKIEIGFFYLMSFFRMFGAHYTVFIAALTLVNIVCLHRFIKKFSPLPILALTIFFAVYSITYLESNIRQFLAMSIAMGFVFVDWSDQKYWRAILGIVIAGFLHNSAFLLLVLPVLFLRPRGLFLIEWKRKTSALMLGLLLVGAAVVNLVDLTQFINLLPARLSYTIMSYYAGNASFSLMALGNRTLFMAITFALAWRAKEWLSERDKLLFNLYCVGYALYLVFLSFDLIAARTNAYFRATEIVLLPLLLYKNKDLVKRTVVALPVLCGLLCFLFIKDTAAIMDYANYYNKNPLNYPYITIFTADTLMDQKFVNVKNANALNAYETGGFQWDAYVNAQQRKPQVRSPIVPY